MQQARRIAAVFRPSDLLHWPDLCHCSGYDFGYLLKILTCQPLPANEADFFELLNLYFPNIFDMKYLMKVCIIAALCTVQRRMGCSMLTAACETDKASHKLALVQAFVNLTLCDGLCCSAVL
jgi:hypothetical protein